MTDTLTNGDTTMHTWTYHLRRGHSDNPSGGACAMDAVNWLVHGQHGDQPVCASPAIGAYVIALNDAMPDDQRQRLLPFLPRIAGSRSSEHEQIRAEIFARGAVRVLAPLPADAPMREAEAAAAAAEAAWDAALALLDEALSAGPQGEPWSADVVEAGLRAYREAGGLVTCHD